ncbi:MAG TPA: tyrosine-protein phosphatase [Acetobacteraceae bacterium]
MTTTAEELPRAVPLEGGSNLRDIGGWRAADGRIVRFGRVYRSAMLHGLTEADMRTLARLGVRTICDFRGDGERARWPSRLPEAVVHELTIAPTIGASLRELVANAAATEADVVAVMQQAYAAYAMDWHHRYRHMFDLLLEPDAPPLLFHCTAGKDRTGFGAAILLTALGVPEELVRADYMATNRLWRGDADLAATLPPAVGAVMLKVHPEFLTAAFDAILAAHGSVEAYLAERMGLEGERLERLRDSLLQ